MTPDRPKPRSWRREGTLYFFPAFLPLAQFLPWILTALGAVAGVAGMSGRSFWVLHRRKVWLVALVMFASAGGIYAYHLPDREVRADGTNLILPENHYQPTQHTTATPFVTPPVGTSFTEIMRIRANKQILSTPLIAEDLVLFGTLENSIEAFARQDGKHVWSLPQRNPVFSLSHASDGVIISGDGQHYSTSSTLTRFDAASATIHWSREFIGHIEELPTLDEDNDRLFTAAGPSGLWAVRISDGGLLWRQEIGHMDARPLMIEDTLYAPAQPDESKRESVFYAVYADNGTVLWKLPLPGQPWGSPVADKTGEIILTSTGQGQIGVTRHDDTGWAQAISRDGKLLWQTQLPGMPLQPCEYVASLDLVIHSLKSGEIVALNVKDGSFAWRVRAGEELQAPGIVVDNGSALLVASTSYDGIFTIRSAKNGQEIVRLNTDKYSTASPTADGDLLYVPGAWDIHVFSGLQTLREQN